MSSFVSITMRERRETLSSVLSLSLKVLGPENRSSEIMVNWQDSGDEIESHDGKC